jgi:hypothetical protein
MPKIAESESEPAMKLECSVFQFGIFGNFVDFGNVLIRSIRVHPW